LAFIFLDGCARFYGVVLVWGYDFVDKVCEEVLAGANFVRGWKWRDWNRGARVRERDRFPLHA
jgi:hypothetical protein